MPDLKKAYFRCDASSTVGLGHFMRCMTLANALNQIGWETTFLSDLTSDYDFSKTDQSKFKILSDNEIPDYADLVVIDHYGLDSQYHRNCRDWAKKVMVIDDLANRDYDCDILLDQTYGRDETDYKNLTPENCKILCGHNYILLKEQFLAFRKKAEKKRCEVKRVENILVNFGSTNPEQIIQKTLEAISKFSGWPLTINVVCSSITGDLKSISNLILTINGETKHDAKLYVDVSNMADFMMEADLAIGAGGTTSWERASLGLPTLLIEISNDQGLVSHNLEKKGAILYLGEINKVTEQHIDKGFQSVRDNGEILRQMSDKAFEICDGQGVSRVLEVINR